MVLLFNYRRIKLIVPFLIFFLGLFVGIKLSYFQNIAISVGRTQRLLPIYSVDTKEKKVALSFDATWGAKHTPKLLEILKKHKVKSTFFLTNIWLKEYPEVAKKIVQEGHEIGLHSATHPHFTSLSEKEMEQELKENSLLVEKTTGYKAKLFRPPFGDYNDQVIRVVKSMGLWPIQWDVDSLDWQDQMSQEDIYNRVTKNIKPGSIVLFHNNGQYTADVLSPLLDWLEQEGYEVVPIGELIIKGDYYVDHAGVQHSEP
ncbi:MAG: peptidoglycan-N-acetylglucosamine deacetylase [Clostridia bacterium]|nr:peptidoglycan-N-acetylglucosamine deacetylase [Clostridia bacterium]